MQREEGMQRADTERKEEKTEAEIQRQETERRVEADRACMQCSAAHAERLAAN